MWASKWVAVKNDPERHQKKAQEGKLMKQSHEQIVAQCLSVVTSVILLSASIPKQTALRCRDRAGTGPREGQERAKRGPRQGRDRVGTHPPPIQPPIQQPVKSRLGAKI